MTPKSFPLPQRPARRFLPETFQVGSWDAIQPFYDQLLARALPSLEALRQWFSDRNELEGVLAQDMGWRYIHMTCDTTNKAHKAHYEAYVKEILPHTLPLTQQLDEKALQCPYVDALRQEPGFDILLRCMENSLQIYRPENVPLLTQMQLKARAYGETVGKMTVTLAGQELTLPQAAVQLEVQDRVQRQEAYEKIAQRRLQDVYTLDALYTALVQDRHQIALNAGFSNYRDYAFVAMNRFDYTPQDCFAFHEAIEAEVVPVLNLLAQERAKLLGISSILKPWDKHVDSTGKPPLRPFRDTEDLLDKAIMAFDRLDPFLGHCLRTMKSMKHFDLASRKGKAPGGYNYPLDEIGVPFIFMNAASTRRDLETLLHEGGHAVHSFLTRDLAMHAFKHVPSELAELASMSMELLTIDQWHLFFEDKDDLKRARRQHFVQILEVLAWVAAIDQFQHWVYEHPNHTVSQRTMAWREIFDRFTDSVTDWTGQQAWRACMWQKQLHLFELPFYYIEYGIAQLGAVAVWKRYQEDPAQGLQGYMDALRLGYTRPIPQVYQTAGIAFDFSRTYIKTLVQFIHEQIVYNS